MPLRASFAIWGLPRRSVARMTWARTPTAPWTSSGRPTQARAASWFSGWRLRNSKAVQGSVGWPFSRCMMTSYRPYR